MYGIFTYVYHKNQLNFVLNTVDGRNPANQLRFVVHPRIYTVLYIPGGAGFLPSTVLYSSLFFGKVFIFDWY